MNRIRKKVVVVGAGISGLAAAYYFQRHLPAVWEKEGLLLDAAPQAGGLIASQPQGDFLLESGPDAFLTEKPAGVELCRELGLESRLIGTSPDHRRSFVVWKQKLYPLPAGLYLGCPRDLNVLARLPFISLSGKIRMASEIFVPRRVAGTDESVAGFFRRRFGKEAVERLAGPLIGGIYMGDPERLSLKTTLGRFAEMENRSGSLIRALAKEKQAAAAGGPRYGLFATFPGGMQELVDALIRRLPAATQQLGTGVKRLRRQEGWQLELQDGRLIETDALCLAVPAWKAAELLAGDSAVLAGTLSTFEYASAVIVTLAWRREDIAHPLDGFGFVVSAREATGIVGGAFNSVKFPGRAPEGQALIRVFLGGALKAAWCAQSDEAVFHEVEDKLGRWLGIRKAPSLREIRRLPRSMPQYHLNHASRVENLEKQLSGFPGIFLAGNAYHGVGLPDCIAGGRRAAQGMADFLQRQTVKVR